MCPILHATSLTEIQDFIRDPHAPRCMPVAGNTKQGLAAAGQSDVESLQVAATHNERQTETVRRLSLTGLTGITAYEPSEFLITARAGTTIQELNAALSEHRQFLPFDPMFASQGATLGGTIASGVSGPSCLLYGGLRDFVMEVELIDGLGHQCRGGGKVVKNAAGFDLPKLVCGSYGRLGVLTEATVKVLPQPNESWALTTQLNDLQGCILAIQKLRSQPLPISSLVVLPDARLFLTLSGPSESVPSVTARIPELVRSDWVPSGGNEAFIARLSDSSFLIRVTMDTEQIHCLSDSVEKLLGVSVIAFCGGASVAWLNADDLAQIEELDVALRALGCRGVVVRGEVDRLRVLGDGDWLRASQRIQSAIDPKGRFASY